MKPSPSRRRTGRTEKYPSNWISATQHGSSPYSKFASMSVDEELELYDLLELDAVGEEDRECADIDLDGTTQDVLGA